MSSWLFLSGAYVTIFGLSGKDGDGLQLISNVIHLWTKRGGCSISIALSKEHKST